MSGVAIPSIILAYFSCAAPPGEAAGSIPLYAVENQANDVRC